MDDESKKLLIETADLVRENHAMLKKVRRVQKNSQMLRGLYWLFIIALAFGAFHYIAPYVKQIQTLYGSFGAQSDALKSYFQPTEQQH